MTDLQTIEAAKHCAKKVGCRECPRVGLQLPMEDCSAVFALALLQAPPAQAGPMPWRLQIAAQCLAGMLGNPDLLRVNERRGNVNLWMSEADALRSLILADALIAATGGAK